MTTISDAKTLNEKKINLWNYFLLIWIPFIFLVELIDKLFLCIFKIIFKKIRTFYLKVNLSMTGGHLIEFQLIESVDQKFVII